MRRRSGAGRVLQGVAGGLPADGAGRLLAAVRHHSGNLHSLDSLRQVEPLPSLPSLHYRAGKVMVPVSHLA